MSAMHVFLFLVFLLSASALLVLWLKRHADSRVEQLIRDTEQSQVQILKDRLYGENGLQPLDIKITPGNNRYATPEEVAGEINKALDQLENGDFEVIAEIGQ